jgi:type VI secretion system secreted protein Hcp
VTLAIRKTGGEVSQAGKPYLVFSFGTVFCTRMDWSGPGDEGPEEAITFAYGALDIAYANQKTDGTLEPLKSASWNQMSNKGEFVAGVSPRQW